MKICHAIARVFKHSRLKAVTGSALHQKARIGAASQVIESAIDRRIGRFSSIADLGIIGGATHAMDNMAMSPGVHAARNHFKRVFSAVPAAETPRTTIGHDVWIGHGTKIVAGVHIGKGAVVVMGAVVKPHSIVGGLPARLLQERTPPEVAQKIGTSAWWDRNDKTLQERAQFFANPRALIEAR